MSTSEDSNVGVVVSHTLTPAIINEYGSYGLKDPTSLSGWDTVSINESLSPFHNEMDSDRLIMATKHAIQVTPTDGNESPIVASSGEFIIPQIASSRFVQRAKQDGEVIEIISNKVMTIKYKDGSFETFDILPRLSRTKMGQFLLLNVEPSVKLGGKVKANEIVAATKNFKDGMYASGANKFIAIMNPIGAGQIWPI